MTGNSYQCCFYSQSPVRHSRLIPLRLASKLRPAVTLYAEGKLALQLPDLRRVCVQTNIIR
jgi:hypothetical protein